MPAYGNFVLDKGFKAAAAITKFRAVKGTGNDGEVTPVTAVTDVVIGVAQYSVSAGEITKQKLASIRMAGITEMECAGTIQQGALVCINASGQAVTATTGNRVIGVAQADGASGTRIPVAITLGAALSP
jgi:hypothetical protein